jgi:hypothetical protein
MKKQTYTQTNKTKNKKEKKEAQHDFNLNNQTYLAYYLNFSSTK